MPICRLCEQDIKPGELRERAPDYGNGGGWEHKLRMDCVRALQTAIAKLKAKLP